MNSQDFRNLQESYLNVYEQEEVLDEGDNYDKNRQRAAQRAAARNDARKAGKTGIVPGVGYVTPRPERETYRDAAGVERHKTGGKMPTKASESYDLYDFILSHLIDEGYADTEEAAERIMVNMSEGWRETIVEMEMDPRGRPASGPMNVYANPKGKPDQARLDAIKSYEDEQKKKTPEQRKKELDDYRERQMNNK